MKIKQRRDGLSLTEMKRYKDELTSVEVINPEFSAHVSLPAGLFKRFRILIIKPREKWNGVVSFLKRILPRDLIRKWDPVTFVTESYFLIKSK